MNGPMVPAVVLVEIRRQLADLQSTISALTSQLATKDKEIERLNQLLLNARRARFGQSSEKSVYVIADGAHQLSVFDDPDTEQNSGDMPVCQACETPDKGAVQVAGHARKKKRTKEELFASLPRETRIIDLPEERKVDAQGRELCCIGQEYLRTEVTARREEATAVEIYRKVYANKQVEQETGFAEIVKPDAPAALIPHSYASPSLVTSVLVKKYVDALPLYRQEQIWRRIGVPLKRGTMAAWAIFVAEHYLRPVWQRFREELIRQHVIHADETVLQVLKEEGRSPTSESRMWVYASSARSETQIRCFDYHDNRAGQCAKGFLDGFHGVLISDGYSGYNKVKGRVRAGCWAHVRRKWREAMPKDAAPQNSRAVQGYEYCNRLFALERTFEGMSDDDRRHARQEKSRLILEEFWAWLDTVNNPSGKLKEAVTYARNQKKHLETFLDHGEIEISNNQVENAIRPFVVGRKGWLFCDTPNGAHASAILYSVMETTKVNHLRIDDYAEYLLTSLAGKTEAEITPMLGDLLPWSAAMRARFGSTDT